MRLSIAQGDIASDLLPVCKLIGSGDLPVAESRPAGIQPQGLGQQDKLLAVVTDFLVQKFFTPEKDP